MKNDINYHFAFGIHSGFPVCCIRDFIKRFHSGMPFGEAVAINRERDIKIQSLYGTGYHRRVHYAPCDDCINKRNFVLSIHVCKEQPNRDCKVFKTYRTKYWGRK